MRLERAAEVTRKLINMSTVPEGHAPSCAAVGMINGDYQKRTLKPIEPVLDLKLLQDLATGQSDRHTLTTVAHIH
jgi:hypothetical protein